MRLQIPITKECNRKRIANALKGRPLRVLSLSENFSSDCPVCFSPLVVRSGQRGAFEGCSNFPRCRFTRSIK